MRPIVLRRSLSLALYRSAQIFDRHVASYFFRFTLSHYVIAIYRFCISHYVIAIYRLAQMIYPQRHVASGYNRQKNIRSDVPIFDLRGAIE
jgi:hypothetical protein